MIWRAVQLKVVFIGKAYWSLVYSKGKVASVLTKSFFFLLLTLLLGGPDGGPNGGPHGGSNGVSWFCARPETGS